MVGLNRQEWNKKVLDKLDISNKDIILELIDTFPQQRFGQIICNYICPDYRDLTKSKETEELIEKIFPKKFDFFFEEPWETYKRLEL